MTENIKEKIPRLLLVLLAFCMFSTGAAGLVEQYVLATMTTIILGNSIEQFSLVIACMMLMMGVSGLVQRVMSDRNLLQKFILVEIMIALLGAFSPLMIYAAYGYLEHHFIFVHYGFLLSIGFLIGFEIPLVMRIVAQQKIGLKVNLTVVYAMDYIGAFFGAIVWVFYLLKNHPLTEISFIVAGFNFVVAAVAVLYFMYAKLILHPKFNLALLSITLLALIWGFNNNREMSVFLEQRFYADPIVYQETTKYQHLVITHNKVTGDIRLYINGNTQFSSLDEVRYHESLVFPLMAAVPRKGNVLVLGGGDGLALRELNKYLSIQQITLVDLDPEMIRIASENKYLTKLNQNAFKNAKVLTELFNMKDTGDKKSIYLADPTLDDGDAWATSVDVVNIDADMFLRKAPKAPWDAVIIDLPDPSSIELSKLYSKQFYMSLKRHLSPNAYIAIQSTSPYHAKEAYLSIGATLQAAGFKVLPYRQNIPSFGDWGYYLAWSNSETPEALKERLSTLTSFEVESSFLTPELLASTFAFGKGELVLDDVCINTLMWPCLLDRYTEHSWLVE
jgi:spermidine synthase